MGALKGGRPDDLANSIALAIEQELNALLLADGLPAHQAMAADAAFAADGRPIGSRNALAGSPADALPAIVLIVDTPAEASIIARFRVGNGLAGNVGAGSLVHIARPAPALMTDPAAPAAPPPACPGVRAVWQPLAAHGSEEAEQLAAVRSNAPSAMHAEQFRAVTEADWERAALSLPGVAAARASLRWTGSWHTVFVAFHPADGRDLVPLPGGGAAHAPGFSRRISAGLNRWRLAGRDLAVRAGQYVSLQCRIRLCIAPGHFRAGMV